MYNNDRFRFKEKKKNKNICHRVEQSLNSIAFYLNLYFLCLMIVFKTETCHANTKHTCNANTTTCLFSRTFSTRRRIRKYYLGTVFNTIKSNGTSCFIVFFYIIISTTYAMACPECYDSLFCSYDLFTFEKSSSSEPGENKNVKIIFARSGSTFT